MGVKIFGNVAVDCKVGISVPNEPGIEVGHNVATACEIAIEVRDRRAAQVALGISEDADSSRVSEIVQRVLQENSIEAGVKAASDSRAQEVLAAGANLTTLVAGLYALRHAGLIEGLLALLRG